MCDHGDYRAGKGQRRAEISRGSAAHSPGACRGHEDSSPWTRILTAPGSAAALPTRCSRSWLSWHPLCPSPHRQTAVVNVFKICTRFCGLLPCPPPPSRPTSTHPEPVMVLGARPWGGWPGCSGEKERRAEATSALCLEPCRSLESGGPRQDEPATTFAIRLSGYEKRG